MSDLIGLAGSAAGYAERRQAPGAGARPLGA